MKIETVVAKMNEPTEWLKGKVFAIQINFLNPEYIGEDETSFDVDCTKPDWRSEVCELWHNFAREFGFPDECVTDAWATIGGD